MELDLTEYDQVDEVKTLMMGNTDGMSSKFIVTMSSSSEQTSIDETNCENDFVFLPGPPTSNNTSPVTTQHQQSLLTRSQNVIEGQIVSRPLGALTSCGNATSGGAGSSSNPFAAADGLLRHHHNYHRPAGNLPTAATTSLKPPATEAGNYLNLCADKPFGLLVPSSGIVDPNKLAELMQQIVTGSDLIYIAIPCSYCQEPIACPPSDISSWLNHMSKHHNCKLCPICNRLVGLGPFRDIEVMRRHVIEHLNSEWLEQPASKFNFTFGLQKQWFSGSRCSVRDPRYK